MTTMNVKDAAGSTVAVEKPLAPGQTTMAASRPVAIASDQSAVAVSLASVPSHAVTNAGTFATQSAVTAASGSFSSGALASGSVASGAFASGALASGSIAAGAVAAGATSIADNEDVASADGDRGVKVLVRRANTAASSSGTDGDYQFPITNTRGAIWMAIEDGSGGQVTSFSGPTQYTEDAAAASDPVGSMLVAVRRDTLSTSEVSADGDNIALKATNKGQLHVRQSELDGIASVVSTALEASHVILASAGDLYEWHVAATVDGWVLVFDATSAPGDGAVTPKVARQVGAGVTALYSASGSPPTHFATGITMVFSTTGPFTKTGSATAFFSAKAR